MSPNVATKSNLDYALEYLKRGFSIFPVHSPQMPSKGLSDRDIGKRPLVKWEALQHQLPTKEQVKDWWTRWPIANIGVATGKTSGVFVLDADGRDGMDYLTKRFGGLPDTLMVYTKKGGHFYFRHPGFKVKNIARIAPALDVRGDGGYAILPPSRHKDDFTYDWADWNTEISLAPDWVLSLVEDKGGDRGSRLDRHDLVALLKGAPDGQRHDSLIRLAGHWFGIGLPLKEVELLALAWNNANKPPSAVDDILRRVRNLWEAHLQKRANPDGPTYVREGDEFSFIWPDQNIRIELRHLREAFDGLQGEITIYLLPSERVLHWGRLKLASTSAREELVKKLKKSKGVEAVNWGEVLQQFARTANQAFKAGTPTVELRPSRSPVTRNFVDPLMPEHETTVFFGDGGSGKSTLALAVAVAVATGRTLPNGIRPVERKPVLYLDWESCLEEHADRLAMLLKGWKIPAEEVEGFLHYRSMVRPMADEVASTKADVSRLGIGMVIVDSYVPAAGLEPESSDAAQRMMNALRELSPASKLVITHVSKADAANGNGTARAFGSVFVQNLPRSVWFVKRTDSEDDDIVIALHHKKVNRGRKHSPIGLRFHYTDDAVEVSSEDITKYEDLRKGISLRTTIRGCLLGGPKTISAISEELDHGEGSIRVVLNRMRSDGVVDTLDMEGREKSWVLIDTKHQEAEL